MTSVSFCFPSWHLEVVRPPAHTAAASRSAPLQPCWADDLKELSGDEEQADAEPSSSPYHDDGRADSGAHTSSSAAAPQARRHIVAAVETDGSNVPSEVLLLVLSQLPLASCVSASRVCRHWHSAVYDSNELWLELHDKTLAAGRWTRPPYVGAALACPPRRHISNEHSLRTTLVATSISVRFMALRKGYEYLLEACDALWHGVHDAVARCSAATAVIAGAGGSAAAASARPLRLRHVDELWQPGAQVSAAAVQIDDKYNAKKMSNMVQRLTGTSWALLFEGTAAIFATACDDIRWSLLQLIIAGQNTGSTKAACVCGSSSSSLRGRWGSSVVNSGPISGALEDDYEPEVKQACMPHVPVPSAGINLWHALLTRWDAYRRWLDVVSARFGPLGARVEAERQLLDVRHATSLPHLLNKGLLAFRSQVLLAYRLRRPLQAAALWLLAQASVDGQAWRDGGGISDDHLQVLGRLRRLLTELNVYDDASQALETHTRDKLQRCFGSLFLRDKKAERFGLRERG